MGPATVTVDPRCKLSYQTYVLKGLEDAGCTIRFRRLDCPPSTGMAMQVAGRRVWVHTDDNAEDEQPDAVAWADVVARVNALEDATGVLPLGPLFGLRIWPLPGGYAVVARLVRGGAGPRKAVSYVRFQGLARVGIDAYGPGPSE
jgi:hypothetical protein